MRDFQGFTLNFLVSTEQFPLILVLNVVLYILRCSGEVIGRDAVPLAPETSLSSHRVRYGFHAFRANYAEPAAKVPTGSATRYGSSQGTDEAPLGF